MANRVNVEKLLSDTTTRVVVCCGAGGVGKTTASAAVGLLAAELGRKVVVLTIDPARRLAQALGVDELTNLPQRVPIPSIDGVEPHGTMHAMMLDMRQTFDELVTANTSPERAEAILDNRFYNTIATSFAGTQEYMAMEKLGQLLEESSWDLIVVDTPPSRNALDFLDAPQRLGRFLDGRMMRLLTAPGRGLGKMVSGVVGIALKAVATVVGSNLLADASTFVTAMDSTLGGFHVRAQRTFGILSRPGTAFLVISTLEQHTLREASYFVDRLTSENMPLAGVLLNRTHPRLADISAEDAEDAAAALDQSHPTAASILRIHADRAVTARRELRLLSGFTKLHAGVAVVGVPSLPFELSNLDALRAIGDQLVGPKE